MLHSLPVGKGSREILRTQHIVGLQPGRCKGKVGLACFRPMLSDMPRWWVWLSEGRECLVEMGLKWCSLCKHAVLPGKGWGWRGRALPCYLAWQAKG